MLIRSTRI
jgi:hypothetical protein